MCKIDIKFSCDRRQSPVGSIQYGICGHIVLRSEPFAFEYAPQCFCNVQMRGIWGQKEKEQSSLFPNGSKPAYEFAPVYFSVVQNKESFFPYPDVGRRLTYYFDLCHSGMDLYVHAKLHKNCDIN